MRRAYDVMRAHHVKPDHNSLFLLLQYYSRIGDDPNVKFVVQEVLEHEIKLNFHFANILLKHASKYAFLCMFVKSF